MRINHFNQRARAAIAKTYDECKPLARLSYRESDAFWELAEELMRLEAERRKDPEWAKREEERDATG